MPMNPPLRGYGAPSGRFWRNVTLITLAHVALIGGLIRWSSAARSEPDAESLVWLSGAEDLAAEKSEVGARQYAKSSNTPIESEPLKPDESEKERPSAKSEIDLPTPEPKPTATPVLKTTPPKVKARPTPKPAVKPMAKTTVLAKASKSSGRAKSNLPEAKGKQTDAIDEKKKSAKTVSAKTKSSSDKDSGKTGSAGKPGSTGAGSSDSEFGWYGNMLHDRFYSAWIQPTSKVASGTKISTLVKIRIEKDGRVSKFELIKPSQNAVVNESVSVVAKQVTQVDPPPTGLIHGEHYDVRINFELNTNRETTK
jgi:outer membrane biosynthesis protein TonB